MDLRLYFRVLWRFRLIVAAGLALGLLLALLSYTRVSFAGGKPSISYRQAETWKSNTELFLTQGGFPWGRTVLPINTQETPTGTQILPSNFADPSRFRELAQYYALFANSDEVQRLIGSRTKNSVGKVSAQPAYDPISHFPLSFVQIQGLGPTAKDASTLANEAAGAFKDYLTRKQADAGIQPAQRVQVQINNRASAASLLAGRKKTTPVVIFLTIMLAAIGLAFILENLRPRVQLVGRGSGDQMDTADERRSA